MLNYIIVVMFLQWVVVFVLVVGHMFDCNVDPAALEPFVVLHRHAQIRLLALQAIGIAMTMDGAKGDAITVPKLRRPCSWGWRLDAARQRSPEWTPGNCHYVVEHLA